MAGRQDFEGTIDGEPAVIRYYPDRKQAVIYWGGIGHPEGVGHNHATINDARPDQFHYLRVNGRVIVNQSYNPQNPKHVRRAREQETGSMLADAFRTAWRRNRRYWGF